MNETEKVELFLLETETRRIRVTCTVATARAIDRWFWYVLGAITAAILLGAC